MIYQKTLKTLEYEKIVDLLADEAESSLGKEFCKKVKPSTDIDVIETWLKKTDEAYKLLLKRGNPPLYGVKKIRNEIKRVEIGGSLSPEGLLKIAETLRCSRDLKKFLLETKEEEQEEFPEVEEMINSLSTFQRIENEIYKAIISKDEISDDASPKLRNIRMSIKNKTSDIKIKLNAIITSEDNKKYLQDAIYSMRDGRYVVPVKRDFKSNIPGMVHDLSSSGQTYFIEPMAIVELNNEIRELEVDEQKEIERILKRLSEMVAANAKEIGENEFILQELDFTFAKGKLAIKQNASMPILNKDGIIDIKKGRHPLLKEKNVVPIDIYLGRDFNTLVITGPNTGGKTVSLKTVGLLSLMAQSGFFIPANDNSELAVFDDIFADIGDEQSIEQSLSTFSSHMVNIVGILKRVKKNSLVLFDELGAGTDPTEGAVLAIAILEKLRKQEIRSIATTHYNQLKVYAMTTENVENASMEFDIETLSPTFRLLIGIPGKSNAFEISRRLGLQDEIIENAKELVEAENIKFEDMLTEIEKNREIIEAERLKAQKISEEMEVSQEKTKKHLEKTEEMRERILNEAREEAREIIRNAREESKLVIDEMKEIAKSADENTSRRIQEAQDILRNSEKKLDAELQEDLLDLRTQKPAEDLKPGDSVSVPSLNQEGIVINAPDANGNTLVQIGIMKMNLPLDSLKPIEGKIKTENLLRNKKYISSKTKTIKTEADVRGKTVDEAVAILDKYLDDAYLSGLKRVEIIHGKGTGALREGLQSFFKMNPHIENFRLGTLKEGGDGVTIVELK